MKFLIHNDINFQEELDGIANGLMANGDNVSGFHQTIFRAWDEQKPDILVLTKNSMMQKEVITFLMKKRPRHLIVDDGIIQFSDGKSVNIPSFANTLKYKRELPLESLKCDIFIYNDGRNPHTIHSWYYALYKNYSVKISGMFIDSPGYIGVPNLPDITKMATSAKFALSTNKIVVDSLIYNGLFAWTQLNAKEFNKDICALEDEFLDKRQLIITERDLGNIIRERLSNPN